MLHNLRRLEAGLRGEVLFPEPEPEPELDDLTDSAGHGKSQGKTVEEDAEAGEDSQQTAPEDQPNEGIRPESTENRHTHRDGAESANPIDEEQQPMIEGEARKKQKKKGARKAEKAEMAESKEERRKRKEEKRKKKERRRREES